MKALYTEKEAAEYIGFSFNSLRNSRNTGLLSGQPAPKHRKIGKAVRYHINDLDNWVFETTQENNKTLG